MLINFFEKYNKLSWIITLIIAGIIFYISARQFGKGGVSYGYLSYIYHFFAFFFLSIFLLISMTKGKNKSFVFPAILIAIAYGISDEIHQFFVPFRSCNYSDALLNSIGILYAGVFYTILRFRK